MEHAGVRVSAVTAEKAHQLLSGIHDPHFQALRVSEAIRRAFTEPDSPLPRDAEALPAAIALALMLRGIRACAEGVAEGTLRN